jgi:hypothetical protein
MLHDATRRYTTLHDTTRRYTTLHDATRRNTTLHDATRRYTTLFVRIKVAQTNFTFVSPKLDGSTSFVAELNIGALGKPFSISRLDTTPTKFWPRIIMFQSVPHCVYNRAPQPYWQLLVKKLISISIWNSWIFLITKLFDIFFSRSLKVTKLNYIYCHVMDTFFLNNQRESKPGGTFSQCSLKT